MAAVEAVITAERYDVVVVAGDLVQRARPGELQRAAAFLRDAQRVSRMIVVPGNHDVAWWRAPLGLGARRRVTETYRRYIADTLEPVLRVGAPPRSSAGDEGGDGATFVGLNTAHGVTWRTLTWNPRDIRVIGALSPAQLDHAAAVFARAPAGDARIVVMHHNPMRGELSRRFGVRGAPRIVRALVDMGADLVLCGHDHQEAVHHVVRARDGHATLIVVAGTVSSRSRGNRASSIYAITLTDASIEIVTRTWAPSTQTFAATASVTFPR